MTLDAIKHLPLSESLGRPVACALLAGMGFGRAYKVDTDKAHFVLKGSREQRERLFYERIAPIVNAAGIPTPELLWSHQDKVLSWVALEWLPRILPESRWRVDDEVFGKLALLHNLELHNLDLELNGIVPETIEWTSAMNQVALSVCPRDFAEENKSRLEDLCSWFQYLFAPNYFLSGDPSGRNWGLRDNGQLVLFDWERFVFGMPQLDLADVAFGEPPIETFRAIANGYLKYNPIEPDVEKFTLEIQVARMRRCISMLSSHAQGIGHCSPRIIELTVAGLGQLLNRVKKS
jgi:hypothetical protein